MSELASAASALLASAAILWVPGLLVMWPVRTDIVARATLAASASVALVGVAGVVFGTLGVAFAAWQPVVLGGVIGIGIAVAGRGRLRLSPTPLRALPTAAVWAVSSIVLATLAYAAMGSAGAISQTYDNVFHFSAIAEILAEDDASSLTLRTLTETARSFAPYPSGWHSLVALVVQITGVSIPIATNAMWVAVACCAWLPGAAWASRVLLRSARPASMLVAMPIAATAPTMPFVLLAWGTLYPTYLATALLPGAVAVTLIGARVLRASYRRHGRAIGSLSAWVVCAISVGLSAIAFAQARALATWALIIAIAAAGWASTAWLHSYRMGGAPRRRAVRALSAAGGLTLLAAAGALWFATVRLGLFERPLEERLGGPQARAVQSILDGVVQVISQAWLTGDGAKTTAPLLPLAIVTAIGACVAVRRRGLRWVVVAFAVIALLYVLAAGSDDIATKLLTGLWFKDRFRLSSALPTLGVPLATLGILWAASTLRRQWARESRTSLLTVLAACVTVTSAAIIWLTGSAAAIAGSFFTPERAATTEYVSWSQIRFFSELAQHVPEGQRILGDPFDGSAWTRVFGDREAVFPHLHGGWDPDRLTLAWSLDRIDTDPEVCAALDRLAVRYVVYSPHQLDGGDPSGSKFPAIHRAVEQGLFTLIDADGDTALYRVDQCGALD